MDTNIETLYNYLHNLHHLDNGSRLYDINKSALQTIKHHGFPSKNNEKWKYIDIKQYIDNILLSDPLERNTVAPLESQSNCVIGKNAILLTDGVMTQDLYKGIKGVNIGVSTNYIKDKNEDFILTLNQSSIQNIINIDITDTLKEPLYLTHTFSNNPLLVSYKININVAKNVSAAITEIFISNSNINQLITYDLSINLDDNAKVENSRFNSINNSSVFLSNISSIINKEAEFTNINISASKASLIKNHINCYLNKDLAKVNLYGLNMINKQNVVDNQTAVFHNVSNCTSNELYKYINKNNATGIFNGKIYVAKDAQQTQAFQQNKNILLSPDAIIHAQPQLEIFANDVKCSHGCTIGQLDRESIFYLKTRGVCEEDAKNMLIDAFMSDILEIINDDQLRNDIYKKLHL
ncbi:MAG: SufB/SufD family protein [Solitalea-like symbiont of Tyrophagus putrescentiae]